jgi:hypothetical protein
VGSFEDRSHAHYAVEQLLAAGFTAEQIGVIAPDAGPIEVPPLDPGTKAGEGAATGAMAGLALGGLLGAALASVALPGVGTVLAGGMLAAVLGGAAAGAAGGTIMGSLIGLNVPADEAKHYEHQFHSGHTLVTVRAGGRFAEAAAILAAAAQRPEQRAPNHGRGRGYGSAGVSGEPSYGGGQVFPGGE